MTESEARALLDAIRTPAGFFAQGRRPFVQIGRWRYEVNSRGQVLTFRAVGKSGKRWALEPYDGLAVNHHLSRIREIGRAIMEVKPE